MRGGFMRNQVRRYVVGVSLVALLSITAPTMAAARDGNSPNDFFSRLRSVIAHILDVDESKLTFPPG